MGIHWGRQALLLLGGASAAFGQAVDQAFDRSLYTSSPPVYPSPEITGIGGWADALARANAFVSQLTLDEKAQIVTGTFGPCIGNIGPIQRLGFGGLCLQDGPLAIRQATYASAFPAGLTAGASWDKGLIHQRGVFLGEEFRGKGSHVALMPVAGPLGRHALGGRNWEGFSPDPYLTGVAMELTIQGVQRTGVQTTSKHFLGNEQETQRNPSTRNGTTIEAISSNIDDRTIRELYMWPFQDAVRAGTASIMCSYNRLNSSYGCQNSKLLNGLLKEELGFQGYVMSDWGATHAGVSSVLSGLDMDMPGTIGFTSNPASFFGGNITTAIRNGSLPEARLDDMVRRIMTPYYHLGQDTNFPSIDPSSVEANIFAAIWPPPSEWRYHFNLTGPSNRDVRDNHAQLIRDLGSAGTVLLKNTNNALPLRNPKNIGIFGNDAGELTNGLYSLSFNLGGNYEYGTLAVGGGSGTARLTYVVNPLDAIKHRVNYASTSGSLVQYILNNTYVTEGGLSTILPSPPEVCIVFLKTWASEGSDRTSLEFDWNGTAVVEEVASMCPNTIVVTHSGGLNIYPFADNPNVTAILAAHLPGQETGNSITDILFGDVNPSGKLPYTIARNVEDYNAPIVNSTALLTTTDPNAWQADFTEGLLIDYRHFDAANITPQYEFGFGLSYTTFDISNVAITKVITTPITPLPPVVATQPGGNPTLWDALYRVDATISNTGDVAGATVAQLYLAPGAGAPPGTPVRVLRGFEKVSIQPGASTAVSFVLHRRDVSYWDVIVQNWRVFSGEMTASVGFSSRDLREEVRFTALM